MTLIDRILAYFGYIRADAPREFQRINNGLEAIARGQRWEAFYGEENGLGDMIVSLRQDYFAKVADLKPGDTDGLRALAMADKIAREIDRKARSVIETGKLRQHDEQHANKIAAIR